MSVEYQPLTNLRDSRIKLIGTAESQVEISKKALFEGILDVLASRVGGNRWRNWDNLQLSTGIGRFGSVTRLVVWHTDSTMSVWREDRAWISTTEGNGARHTYYVEKEQSQVNNDGPYVLYERDPEGNDDNDNAVSNSGGLAPARLFSILAEAHWHTRKEKLTNSSVINSDKSTIV
ncbi:hypothetical protein HYU96_00825 [Candidatus Daviesbacteria bacterium]|nr:hypothetical protein [Candidatus Daviesbacteria bacterium]